MDAIADTTYIGGVLYLGAYALKCVLTSALKIIICPILQHHYHMCRRNTNPQDFKQLLIPKINYGSKCNQSSDQSMPMRNPFVYILINYLHDSTSQLEVHKRKNISSIFVLNY